MIPEAISGKALILRNQQRACRINLPRLRSGVRFHLDEQLGLTAYDIAIHFVSSARMAEVNQTHLKHEGPTDVITFDYREHRGDPLHGELLICPAVAVAQAQDHDTSWQCELLRYIIHGILHLQGFDDLSASDRRVMKREENRRLTALTSEWGSFLL